ncbi:MAG TPA: hypothetical protein VF912_03475 [Anaeromyxobacter sp.]
MAGAPSRARLALGFALAPLAVPLLHAALEVARSRAGPEGYARYVLHDGLLTAVAWTAPLAYAFALPIGIPLVLALRAARRLSAGWVVAFAAALGGGLPTVFAAALAREGLGAIQLGRFAIVPATAVLLSAVVAAAFCAIAGVPLRRRGPRPGPPPRVTSRAAP